jgi:hypothetical protein
MAGDDARQIGAARRSRQRKAQPDQVVRRIADDGLIKIADLDGDISRSIRDRTEVADVTVAADPYGRSLGHYSGLQVV